MTSGDRQPGRRAGWLLVMPAVVLAVLLAFSGSAQARSAGPTSARLTAAAAPNADGETVPAFDSFAGCVRSQHNGDVLVLMDESGTIAQTDPSGARITAMQYLIDSLATRADDERWHLDLALAGFAETYHPLASWNALNGRSAPALKERLRSFANRDDGIDTDYWTALDGAQRALREHARSRGTVANPCQAIVMLTDGELDVDPRTTSSERGRYGLRKPYAPGLKLVDEGAATTAKQLAKTSLCRDGGLADQLRSNGIRTFAIGLSSGPRPPSFSLINSIATGTGTGSARCGANRASDSGYFTPAANLDDLLFAIGNLGGVVNPPGKVCRTAKPCPSGTRSFVLDDSVQRVKILAGVSVPGIQVQLTAPDRRTTLPLSYDGPAAGQGSLGGMPLSWQWATPRTVTASFARHSGAPWNGRWNIIFVDPTGKHADAVSRTVLQITGDVQPALLDAPHVVFRSGAETKAVKFGLVHADDGKPATVLGDASLTVQAQSSDGSGARVVAQLDKAAIAQPVDLDLSKLPVGKATLLLRLQLTTQPPLDAKGKPDGAGTRLQATEVPVPVDIRAPLGPYPAPGSFVDFGNARDTTVLTGSLEVAGPGCIWLAGTTVTTKPDGVRAVAVTAPTASAQGSCLQVPAGQHAQLPLRMSLDAMGSGTVNGRLQLGMLPASGDPVIITATAGFTADTQLPARTLERFLITLLMLALGLGLPVLAALLGAWYTARIPAVPLRWALFEVTVVDGTVRRDGRAPAVLEEELRWLTFGGKRPRRVSIPGGLELRARVLPGLRGGGRVIVDAGPDRHTLSRSMLAPRRFRTAYWHGLLPLAVHQHWAGVLVGPDTVSVLVLFAPTADENQRVKVLAAMTDELPAALSRLQGSTVGPASREPGARSRREEPVRTPDPAPTDGDDWFGDARTPTSGHD